MVPLEATAGERVKNQLGRHLYYAITFGENPSLRQVPPVPNTHSPLFQVASEDLCCSSAADSPGSLETIGDNDPWHVAFGRTTRPLRRLTHDVESPAGLTAWKPLPELRPFGFALHGTCRRSYPIDWNRVANLRARGFEFGAHGLRHDGMLFAANNISN